MSSFVPILSDFNYNIYLIIFSNDYADDYSLLVGVLSAPLYIDSDVSNIDFLIF